MRRLLVLVLAACSAPALAYPHFQLSSDVAICQSCHVAPAGGGMLTDFGRDQSEDPLSGGGHGGLLHGLVKPPRWLTISGDARLAALANQAGRAEGVELAAFPMQADLSARVGTELISGVASVGLRGVVRRPPVTPGSTATSPPWPVLSREHYLLVRPTDTPFTFRAGRFFPPYGLRLADHTAYIRRYLGYDLEAEPYAVSASAVTEGWEAHLTGFVRDPLAPVGPAELGGAALLEARPGSWALGLSGRAGALVASRRFQGGPYAKLWLENARVLLMAEADAVYERFSAPGAPPRWQGVAYVGPVWMPVRGLSLGAAYQAFVEDLSVAGTARHSADVWASYLPISHVEVMLSGRSQWIGPELAWNALLQFHYYL